MRGKIGRIEKALQTKKKLARFKAGDTIEAHVKVREGDKERIQIFEGVCISRRGEGTNAAFTVRKVVQAEGIERTFMVHGRSLAKVVVKKRGKVRRAKLFYLREKQGRAGRVEEIFGTAGKSLGDETFEGGPAPEPTPEPEAKTDEPEAKAETKETVEAGEKK